MKIFSGSSNKPLAQQVALTLGLELSPVEDYVFPDGERRIQIQVPVLGEDVIVVQSTNPPVDQYYIEAFLLIDGLKRNGAKSVTMVMPYMGYMRQDHIFRDGEAVSLLVMIKILESLGVDRFIGIDFHTIKVPEFFHIPVHHLSALPLFSQIIKDRGWNTNDSVLLSPDMGGLRRIKEMSTLLNAMPWFATVKNRDLGTGKVTISEMVGQEEDPEKLKRQLVELSGKRVLVVDDMISSGSIVESINFVKQYGVGEVYVFVTHPIFSAKAPGVLQHSIVDGVFVTDSVVVPDDKKFAKLTILPMASYIAEVI